MTAAQSLPGIENEDVFLRGVPDSYSSNTAFTASRYCRPWTVSGSRQLPSVHSFQQLMVRMRSGTHAPVVSTSLSMLSLSLSMARLPNHTTARAARRTCPNRTRGETGPTPRDCPGPTTPGRPGLVPAIHRGRDSGGTGSPRQITRSPRGHLSTSCRPPGRCIRT